MSEGQASSKEDRRRLIEAIVAYAVFCGLGLISRYIPGVFLIFLLFGIVFPLVWAKIAHDWQSIGFTRRNLGPAIGWGWEQAWLYACTPISCSGEMSRCHRCGVYRFSFLFQSGCSF